MLQLRTDTGADLTMLITIPPVVRVRAVSETSVYEGDSLWLEAELINAPEGGAVEDITVNLVSRNIFTISSADYRSPSSVTIPQGQSRARFEVWALDDDLAENGELLNIYVSSVDYRGRNYKQAAVSVVTGVFPATSKSGVNLLILDTEPPIVEIRPVSDSTVYEGGSVWLEASIVNPIPSEYPDFVRPYQTTVHLATGNATTATESEYSFLSNVTIPGFRQRVRFEVRVNQDDLAEFPETLNIYASSVEFNGQNYEQSDVGTDLNIYSYDDTIQTSITVLGGTDQLEGTTVTVRVELSQALPANTPANAVQLSFSPNSNARTVDGLPFVLDITEALRESTLVEVPFYLTDDDLLEQTGLVDLKVKTTDYSEQLGLILSGAQSFFRIIDNDNDDNEQPTVAVHPVSDSTVYEGRSILLEAVLTNAPQDGTVTVNLASLSATTASEADYAYPSSVTIPRGQSRVEFEVSALQDDLVEDRETFIIYASSFEYGGKEYRQGELFLGVWIDIYDVDDAPAVTLQQVLPTSTSSLLDLGDHGVIYEGGRVWLLARLTNAPADGAIQDITVNLATGSSSTASESDYVYPNSVTIPQGEHQFLFQLDANYDGLEELDETLNIYVSSVDYGGQNYEQSDSGINLTIVDNRKPPIVVLRAISDTTIVEGESVTLEVELTNPLPGGARDDFPVIFLYGSETTASYNDDYIFSTGSNRKGILEGQTYARFNIISLRDDLAEGSETLNLYIYGVFLPDYDDYYLTSKIYQQFGSSINLTIIDNEPPVVAIRSLRDTSTSLTSTSSLRQAQDTAVRRSDLNSVNEGDTVQLVAELTNAPEGGAAEDIAVHLATGSVTTAYGSDYSYPSSVTILQGQSRVTFEVRALQDDLVEDSETLNIYVSSVDFNSQNYEQSDTGVDLTIVDVDFNDPPIVSVRRHGANVGVGEGGAASLIVELINAPEGGAAETITVHLATGSGTTAPESDYSYPSSVTIPRGQSRVEFEVRVTDDDLVEYDQKLNIYASSVDYGGQNYEQSDAGADFIIIDDDEIDISITTLGGVNQPERSTVTVRVELDQALPAGPLRDNLIKLSVSLSNSVRAVSVAGRSLVGGQSFDVDITEALMHSTTVDVPFYVTGDYLSGEPGLVELKVSYANREGELLPYEDVQDRANREGRLLSQGELPTLEYQLPWLLPEPDEPSFFRIVDRDILPIVSLKLKPLSGQSPPRETRIDGLTNYGDIYERNGPGQVVLVAELINAPEGGAPQDITVHLEVGSESTASEFDYRITDKSITIRAGKVWSLGIIWAAYDDLVEYSETLNLYVSSFDYFGENYEQSDSGVDLTIHDREYLEPPIESSITVLDGVDQLEGTTVTVRVGLKEDTPWVGDSTIQMLPENTPANAIELVFSMNDSVHTVDITEALRDSSYVDVPFYLTDDHLLEQTERVDLRVRATYEPLKQLLSEAQSFFRIIDNDEAPVVAIRSDTSTPLSDLNSVSEGDTAQLEVELTNAPEGGAPRDITVNLATGNEATASASDYSYPSSVTIPWGQSRVTFEVSALQDDLVEDDEILNIYVSSVDYGGQSYEQSDTGADLTIVDVDFNDPPIVSVRRFGHNFSVNEGGVAGLIAELIPAPQGGADRDITVHLASGSWSTVSESDYSYPSSVTIPQGQSFVRFDVQALNDDLPEYPETLNVHVSSVDYAGRNYVQSRGGVDLKIISDDRIEPVITVLGGVDHPEGSTVTVRIAVSQVLPADIPVNAITLSVSLSDSVRSVSVDGRRLVANSRVSCTWSMPSKLPPRWMWCSV